MVVTLDCARCGTALKSSPRLAPGKRARCGACGNIFPVGLDPELFSSKSLIAGDDDDDGGGGYGGKGGSDDDESEAADGEDESDDEDEEEEDDGKGGKKKKKGKGKVEVRSGCGLMSYLMTAGVLIALCCICGILGAIFKPSTPTTIAGMWEAKDNDGAELALNFREGGTGTYSKAGKSQDFKWSTTPPNSLDIDLNEATTKLWTDEAKTRFTYDVVGAQLRLTPGTAAGKTMTFSKVVTKSDKGDAKVDKSDNPDEAKDEPTKKGKGSTGKKKR